MPDLQPEEITGFRPPVILAEAEEDDQSSSFLNFNGVACAQSVTAVIACNRLTGCVSRRSDIPYFILYHSWKIFIPAFIFSFPAA